MTFNLSCSDFSSFQHVPIVVKSENLLILEDYTPIKTIIGVFSGLIILTIICFLLCRSEKLQIKLREFVERNEENPIVSGLYNTAQKIRNILPCQENIFGMPSDYDPNLLSDDESDEYGNTRQMGNYRQPKNYQPGQKRGDIEGFNGMPLQNQGQTGKKQPMNELQLYDKDKPMKQGNKRPQNKMKNQGINEENDSDETEETDESSQQEDIGNFNQRPALQKPKNYLNPQKMDLTKPFKTQGKLSKIPPQDQYDDTTDSEVSEYSGQNNIIQQPKYGQQPGNLKTLGQPKQINSGPSLKKPILPLNKFGKQRNLPPNLDQDSETSTSDVYEEEPARRVGNTQKPFQLQPKLGQKYLKPNFIKNQKGYQDNDSTTSEATESEYEPNKKLPQNLNAKNMDQLKRVGQPTQNDRSKIIPKIENNLKANKYQDGNETSEDDQYDDSSASEIYDQKNPSQKPTERITQSNQPKNVGKLPEKNLNTKSQNVNKEKLNLKVFIKIILRETIINNPKISTML